MSTRINNSVNAGSMKAESLHGLTDRIFGRVSLSARVPVTAANREYLRTMRQAELEAWRNAPGGTQCADGDRN